MFGTPLPPSVRRTAIAALLSVVTGSLAALPQPQEETVRFGITIDTNYNDSPEALGQLRTLLRLLPKSVDTLLPGESLEEYVVRRYRFGPQRQPEAREAYALILEDIRRANETAISIPIGLPVEIQIPILPPRALLYPNPANPYNELPKTQSWGFELLGADRAVVAEPAAPLEDRFRRGSDSFFLTIEVPRSYAEAQRTEIEAFDGIQVLSEKLLVELGPTTGTEKSESFLTAEERRYLEDAVRRVRRQTTLFVLDAGWPDAEAQRESMEFLLAAIRDWREKLKLSPLPVTPMPAPSKPHPHTALIRHALSEFHEIDHSRAVRIIFIPLVLDPASEILFSALLETAIVHRRTGTLGEPGVSTDVLAPMAQAEARAVISNLRSAGAPGASSVITNRAIIEAVYELADFIAVRDESFWILNESWGVPGVLLKPQLPGTTRGVTVAATGNNNEIYPLIDREFAGRSMTDSAFVGIINMDRAGALLCGSARVKDDYLDAASLLAISGRVKEACGTSYAAPRVAWILALSEATRGKSLSPQELVPNLALHVRSLRSGQPGLARYQFEINRCCNR